MFFSSKVRREAAEKDRRKKDRASRPSDNYILESSHQHQRIGIQMALKFDAKSDAALRMQAACFACLKEIW